MLAELKSEFFDFRLGLERELAAREGIAMGWTGCDPELRQIAKAVAIAATTVGSGDITVTSLSIVTRSGDTMGIKVTDSANRDLTLFWNLVHDVQAQIGRMGKGPVDSDMLRHFVDATIADQRSGELDRKLEARAREQTHNDDLYF